MTDSSNATKAPRGRGRPPSISSEKLLNFAREVFLERGIQATTLEVAERAGVSEGTLFHRFGTKDALFRQAMSFDEADGAERMADAVANIRQLPLEPALTQLAEHLLEIGRIALPLVMMSWSNPGRCGPNHTEKQKFYEVVKVLAADLQLRIERGELRPHDAEVFSRVFIGSVHHYSMARLTSVESGIPLVPPAMFVRGLVDLMLNGVRARELTETTRVRA
ncbi:MAG TPA: helix-turn-helix domain-containing protein [Polyangiaceae bacterium]|nr:helix-turn-helix domain-containing protein [Polyangiaceae bacterium]